MLARQEGMEAFDDETWADEEFMTKGLDPKGGNTSGAGNSDPGTNIFGSSGGVWYSPRVRYIGFCAP